MRAPLRLVALTLTAFVIGTAIVSRYRDTDPNSLYTRPASSGTWSALHPSNWIPSFHHSSTSKAQIEEQWRTKGELSPEDKLAEAGGSGSAGGSGDRDMTADQKEKAIERLKNQYGDTEKSAEGEDSSDLDVVHSLEIPTMTSTTISMTMIVAGSSTGSSSSLTMSSLKIKSSAAKASSDTKLSSETEMFSSATHVANTTAASNETSEITAMTRPTPSTLLTSIKGPSSSDEFAYLSDVLHPTLDSEPTSTVSYGHLGYSALTSAFQSHHLSMTRSASASASQSTSLDEFGYLETMNLPTPTPHSAKYGSEDLRDVDAQW